MQSWLTALDRMLDTLTLNPHTPTEKWVVVAIAALFAIFIFGIVASMMRVPNTDPARSTILIVAGGLLMMLGAIATERYVCGRVSPAIAPWLPTVAAALVLLAVVIPVSCLWQRSKYVETTITWVASMAGAAMAIYLAASVYDAVASGKKDAFKANRRNKEIEKEFFGR